MKDILDGLVQALKRHPGLFCVSIGVGVLVAFLYFKLFFPSADQFDADMENAAEPVKKSTPWDMFFPWRWWIDPKRVDSEWSQLKIIFWLTISVGAGVLAYYQLPWWFPRLFK